MIAARGTPQWGRHPCPAVPPMVPRNAPPPAGPARAALRRVQVIGPSCAGKTTLGLALAQRLGLRFVDLDELFWEPGWREAPPAVFTARLAQAMQTDGWVLAGNYLGTTRAQVWPALDTLLVLDMGLLRVLGRALRRTVRRGLDGSPCCNGNTEQLSRLLHHDGVLRYTTRTWRARHRLYATLPTAPALAHARVQLLRTPQAAEHWLAEAAPNPSPNPCH